MLLLFSVIINALFTKWRTTPTRLDSEDPVTQAGVIKPKKINILNDKKWEAVAKELSNKSIHMKNSIDGKFKHDKHIDESAGRNQNIQEVNIEAKQSTIKESNSVNKYDAMEKEEKFINIKEIPSKPARTKNNCSCTGRKDKCVGACLLKKMFEQFREMQKSEGEDGKEKYRKEMQKLRIRF